jgi:hypothetical protein
MAGSMGFPFQIDNFSNVPKVVEPHTRLQRCLATTLTRFVSEAADRLQYGLSDIRAGLGLDTGRLVERIEFIQQFLGGFHIGSFSQGKWAHHGSDYFNRFSTHFHRL